MWRLAFGLVLVSSSVLGQQAVAAGADLRDMMSARNIAMGGAYEAMGYGAETIGGNPAGLSLYKRYQLEASGLWDIPQGYGMAQAALADSASSVVAAGVSYQFATFGEQDRRWSHITTMAMAYAIADWLHIGVAGRHHVITGGSTTNSITMNAGIIVRPWQFLSIGVSGHNLINNYNKDITRYFVASVAGMFFNQLSPVFDLWADFNQPAPRFAYHAGLEWLIANTVPVRVGYQYDAIAGHQYIAFGVGYFNEGSGIDLSYRHEVAIDKDHPGDGGRMLALTLKLQL